VYRGEWPDLACKRQDPKLQFQRYSVYLPGLLGGLNELICEKCMQQSIAHNKCLAKSKMHCLIIGTGSLIEPRGPSRKFVVYLVNYGSSLNSARLG
jgi:hypothetical protein